MNIEAEDEPTQQQNEVILYEEEIHEEARNPVFGVQEVEEDLTQLQQYIEEERWEDAMKRLRSHPHEVYHPKAQPGSTGKAMTALHQIGRASCRERVLMPV